MPNAGSMPIFDPSGQLRWVPNDQLRQAIQANGQAAIRIVDPKGVERWIPQPRAGELLKVPGVKLAGLDATMRAIRERNAAQEPGAVSRLFSSAVAPIAGAVKSLADSSPTEAEKQQGLTTTFDLLMRPYERVVEAQTGQVGEAQDLAKQGRYSEAAGHALASAVPLLGPWVADATQEYYRQLGEGNTAGALGTAAGNVALAFAPKVAEEGVRAVGPMTKSLLDTRTKMARGITKTGPNIAREQVADTQAANAKEAERVGEKNAAETARAAEKNTALNEKHQQAVRDAEEKRAQQLRQHFEKTQQVREQNAEKQAAQDRKVALERGVEHLDPEIKGELEKAEDRVNAEANAKYNDLRKVIGKEPVPAYEPVDAEGHISGEPVPFLQHIYDNAVAKITDFSNEPTLLKNIGSEVRDRSTPLTWNDLQDLRTKVGSELRKGTLPSDQFAAYKGMLEDIDAGMQKVADAHDAGAAMAEARSFYRRYAQAFLDRTSPIRKALDSKERGGVTRAFRSKDQSGVEALAQFDPQLARRINTVRGHAEEAASIRKGTMTAKPEPKLTPKPAPPEPPKPVIPKVETPKPEVLTPEKLSAAKQEAAVKAAQRIRNSSNHLATVFVAIDGVMALLHGNIGHLGADVAGRLAYASGKNAFANYLESPNVVQALGKITPEDVREVMKLPPEQRAGFDQFLNQAQARGVKLRPGVMAALVGVESVAGPKTKKLKEMRSQTLQ